MIHTSVVDPLKFASILWPDVRFYDKQREIIYSVAEDADETAVVAGNMLGKDFVAAFIVLWFFLTRHPVRVVTTSADHAQLEAVLWGEMRRFIQTSRVNLNATQGGPIVINHLHLRKAIPIVHQVSLPPKGKAAPIRPSRSSGYDVCGLSYCIGRTAAKGEGMLGHHIAKQGDGIPRTLFVADEASGVDDDSEARAETWADRKLFIGNPYDCHNFFRRAVDGGDLARPPEATESTWGIGAR